MLNKSSGMLEKLYVQEFKIIGSGNLLSLICNFSSNSFSWSLGEEAILHCCSFMDK